MRENTTAFLYAAILHYDIKVDLATDDAGVVTLPGGKQRSQRVPRNALSHWSASGAIFCCNDMTSLQYCIDNSFHAVMPSHEGSVITSHQLIWYNPAFGRQREQLTHSTILVLPEFHPPSPHEWSTIRGVCTNFPTAYRRALCPHEARWAARSWSDIYAALAPPTIAELRMHETGEQLLLCTTISRQNFTSTEAFDQLQNHILTSIFLSVPMSAVVVWQPLLRRRVSEQVLESYQVAIQDSCDLMGETVVFRGLTLTPTGISLLGYSDLPINAHRLTWQRALAKLEAVTSISVERVETIEFQVAVFDDIGEAAYKCALKLVQQFAGVELGTLFINEAHVSTVLV